MLTESNTIGMGQYLRYHNELRWYKQHPYLNCQVNIGSNSHLKRKTQTCKHGIFKNINLHAKQNTIKVERKNEI